ncbi:hypothetical protein ES066_06990 [Bacillus subtilis]|uniref:hypothetical protein n=1 Tax=Bacillus subtilis TaxID=1423 RepID=UPI00102EB3E7|nr:hypothetical protein [Bacillus subtilis]MBU8804507.1 hypothetical protein [Bacillus subtilis]TAH81191.1 hypothetical protein ES060_15445 [Bacillus subtilis]TAH88742.1 hypothetical protein ES066_06990 [Bacillus subtilis]
MRDFYLLFKRDLFTGYNHIKFNFIPMVILNLFFLFYPIILIKSYDTGLHYSYLDTLILGIGGVPIELVEEKSFSFPFIWLFMQFTMVLIVNTWARNDVIDSGSFISIRVRKKWKLILSKFSIIFISTFIFCTVLFVLLFFLCNMFRIDANNYTEYTIHTFNFIEGSFTYKQMLAFIILSTFLGMLSVVFFFTALSYLIKPIYSLLVIATWLVLSIFNENILLIGNLSMILRSLNMFGHSSIIVSLSLQILFILITIILTTILLNKKEILYSNVNE